MSKSGYSRAKSPEDKSIRDSYGKPSPNSNDFEVSESGSHRWTDGSSSEKNTGPSSYPMENVSFDDSQSERSQVSAPPSHIARTQGFGHTDHLYPYGHNYGSPHGYGTSQNPHDGAYVYVAPKNRRKSWLLSYVVFSILVIMFFVEMIVNNCPKNINKDNVNGRRQQCVARFLGRLSFQPLRENPLLGPSISALLDTGALESSLVTDSGQGWRLLTCMWLHAGLIHLLSNMLGIWVIGVPLEKEFGPLKIGAIYLLSGFAGSLMSALFLTTEISVGASGALFGLIGATLAELILNWNRYIHRVLAFLSLLLIIAVNLVLGLMPYVDNFAHIGGLIAGTLLGFSLLLKPRWDWEQASAGGTMAPPHDFTGVRTKTWQQWTRIVAVVLLIAGYIVAIAVLFSGVDANKGCSWCHYLSCVETSSWDCPKSSTSKGPVVCRSYTNSDGSGSLVCENKESTPIPNIGAYTPTELRSLCTQLCG